MHVEHDVVVDQPYDVVAIDGRVTVRGHEFESFAAAKRVAGRERHHSLFVTEELIGRGRLVTDDQGHARVGRHRLESGVDGDVAVVIRRDDGRDQRETLLESTLGIVAQRVAVLAVHEDVAARSAVR